MMNTAVSVVLQFPNHECAPKRERTGVCASSRYLKTVIYVRNVLPRCPALRGKGKGRTIHHRTASLGKKINILPVSVSVHLALTVLSPKKGVQC